MGFHLFMNRGGRGICRLLVLLQCLLPSPQVLAALTDLSDQPMFVTNSVPPNMMLTLSVEWPTGVVAAYKDSYTESKRYLGYFDPERCYGYYKDNGATPFNVPDAPGANGRTASAAAGEYFRQTGAGTGTGNHQCTGAFSGNYLNWASMHALDEFRFAMTGGDRVIDTTNLTVVEKTRHTGNGGTTQFPVKQTSNSNITPLGFATTYARVTKPLNNNNPDPLDPWSDSQTIGRVIEISDNSSFSSASPKKKYVYLVRLQVCDASANSVLEYSSTTSDYNLCQAYGSIYKPVGLIQKNANRMRFGVVAYQYDSSDSHAKGVLRARIKSVGPDLAIPSGSAQTNLNAEWDASTGIYVANPDSSEATASSVSQSGVVNYLHKFGKANGYISKDTLSELYYAGLRALRNLTPPAKYIEGLTPGSAAYDGFPIITTTVNDSNEVTSRPYRPIQYSCQKNNFVGIADTNTHTDVDLPGNPSTLTGYSGHPTGGEITINSPTDEPTNLSVKTQTDKVGTLEGVSSSPGLGSTYQSSGRKDTFHAAGLAYWANTKDILIDDPNKPWTQGKQTAQTYWVDVRESGSDGPVNGQMWLAAKYGGFDDINANGTPASVSTWHTNTDTLTNNTALLGVSSGLRPDNYFTGDSPDKMIASLSQIFNAVLSKSLSSSGATISTIDFSSGSTAGAYTVKYNSKDWTGDVFGNTIQVNSSGTPTVTKIWSAQAQTDTQAAASTYWNSRFIATTNPTASTTNKGVPFRLASLNTTQLGYLGASTTDRQNLLQYLRGDKSNEGTLYRTRAHLLGDIVDSEASAVVGPDGTYYDSFNPGYSVFKTSYASRAARVYVGANDGMLHALSGDVSASQTDGGQEKWAYIPSFVLSGPSAPTTDGLAARSALTGFIHRYYVDQTPYIRDVDFSRTQGATASATGDWHTVLVGGLGKGGKGFYALDVTNPAAITDETTLAAKVLWEFSDEDMGYSFGRPIIAKTARDGWVVILSSGYNNVNGSVAANRGQGYLYILNAKTGDLIQKISTSVGSATNPSGFAHPLAFIPDSADYTLDYVYGGDLNGNLWRFDLTGTGATYPAPLLFAQLTDSSGTPQPVTVEPKVEIGDNGKDRWVFIGTGKMLASADLAVSSQQSFYAFRDGSRTKAYGSANPLPGNQLSLPTSGSFPIGRSQMVRNTNLLIGYAKDQTHPMGWYYELVDPREKISTPIVANEGVVSWTAYLPSTDPCSPGAASKTYAAEYDTGKSRISLNNATVEYFSSNSYLVKVQFVKDSGGKIRAVLTTGDPSTSGGQIQALSGSFGRSYGKGVKVNWREILN